MEYTSYPEYRQLTLEQKTWIGEYLRDDQRSLEDATCLAYPNFVGKDAAIVNAYGLSVLNRKKIQALLDRVDKLPIILPTREEFQYEVWQTVKNARDEKNKLGALVLYAQMIGMTGRSAAKKTDATGEDDKYSALKDLTFEDKE
jgi:hypothetical protein